MPSFSIKRANLGDIAAIISIQEQTWEPTYAEILSREQIQFMFEKIYSPIALKEQMISGEQRFVLLINGQSVVGFASVAAEEPGCYKLHKIYVLPSTQGTGAGKYLLAAMENLVKQEGASKMTLNVNRYNRAKSFYEKMGYSVVREVDIPFGPYWMNDYVLEKILI